MPVMDMPRPTASRWNPSLWITSHTTRRGGMAGSESAAGGDITRVTNWKPARFWHRGTPAAGNENWNRADPGGRMEIGCPGLPGHQRRFHHGRGGSSNGTPKTRKKPSPDLIHNISRCLYGLSLWPAGPGRSRVWHSCCGGGRTFGGLHGLDAVLIAGMTCAQRRTRARCCWSGARSVGRRRDESHPADRVSSSRLPSRFRAFAVSFSWNTRTTAKARWREVDGLIADSFQFKKR